MPWELDDDWEPVMQGWLFRRPDGNYVARIEYAGLIQEMTVPPDKAAMITSMLMSLTRQQ